MLDKKRMSHGPIIDQGKKDEGGIKRIKRVVNDSTTIESAIEKSRHRHATVQLAQAPPLLAPFYGLVVVSVPSS